MKPTKVRRPPTAKRQWALAVTARLAELHPDARCELSFGDPFQLLVAVILSAQCSDKVVNRATPALFAAFPTPTAMAAAEPGEIEPLIRSIGLFRNKAKAIHGAAKAILSRHGGAVPADLDSLTALPGVGRKTANVVLSDGFGLVVGIVTDTHVIRLAGRVGLSRQSLPEKLEAELMALLPVSEWRMFSHRMIWHGRRVCHARRPSCGECGLRELCRYRSKTPGATEPPSPIDLSSSE